jgi:hypothetical protein
MEEGAADARCAVVREEGILFESDREPLVVEVVARQGTPCKRSRLSKCYPGFAPRGGARQGPDDSES